MVISVGGGPIVEKSNYCEVWEGVGYVALKNCTRFSWLWIVEKY